MVMLLRVWFQKLACEKNKGENGKALGDDHNFLYNTPVHRTMTASCYVYAHVILLHS